MRAPPLALLAFRAVLPLVPALVIGAQYAGEAAPAVGGGNSGEFQVMAHQLGIAHPPSYPLYLLLARAFAALPLGGDFAWRVNLVTALAGAAALAVAAWLPSALGFRSDAGALAGFVGASALGAMPRLWSLAVESEVFTLHLLLTVSFWVAVVRRRILVAALVAGLGLANHRTFLFVAAGGALCALLREPALVRRGRVVAGAVALFVLGLAPYVYVLRGLIVPVAYFAPTDVRRLTSSEVWYVLQGNAAGETGGGEVVLRLLSDFARLAQRVRWLLDHLVAQFGEVPLVGAALAVLGALGLALLARRDRGAALFVATSVGGALGAALFAMSYFKYPDADRYLLPLEALLALGLGAGVATVSDALGRRLGATPGALLAAALALHSGARLVALGARTEYTRGGYQYHTLANLQAVERGAVLCTWWNTAWGFWYAQHVDGVRPDVTVVAKGPDECLREVAPTEVGRRAVYLPDLTDAMRRSDVIFLPSRDLWRAALSRRDLHAGALVRAADERVYLYDGAQRHWIPTLETFNAHGFRWDDVLSIPAYVMNELPEGPPLDW